jgi:hypothetical protein
MWFFMNTCYLMSLLTFGLLILALAQNLLHFSIFRANEVTFIILTSIVYLFTETLIIFFFVGTGVSVKEYSLANKLKPDYHRQSIAIKRRVYPPQLLNILFMMILFILVGAVDTGHLPVWVYRFFFVFCLWHFLVAKKIQHDCFRDNTHNILKMSGVTPQTT